MAITLTAKVAQSAPGATTLTDAYTVPASTKFEGKVLVANRSSVGTTFRISLAPAGAADATSQYLAYDLGIPGNDTYVTPTFAVPAACVVRVYATLATVTFTITGLETSA
jgi:hypothetical protein